MNLELFVSAGQSALALEDDSSANDLLKSAQRIISNLPYSRNQRSSFLQITSLLNELQSELTNVQSKIDFALERKLEEIGALYFMSPEFALGLAAPFLDDVTSDREASRNFNSQLKKRQIFFKALGLSCSNIAKLPILEGDEVPRAEIGVQIPREIFDDSFDGFLKELTVVRFVLSSVSMMSLGVSLQAELGTISTSDPLIFFGVDFKLVVAFAACVTWGLNTLNQIQDLKDFKDSAPSVESMEKIKSDLDELIATEVERQVEAELERLRELYGFKSEVENSMRQSLHRLLERLERGMTFELKHLDLDEDEDEDDENDVLGEQIERALELKDLQFPTPSAQPVLQLNSDTTNKPKK